MARKQNNFFFLNVKCPGSGSLQLMAQGMGPVDQVIAATWVIFSPLNCKGLRKPCAGWALGWPSCAARAVQLCWGQADVTCRCCWWPWWGAGMYSSCLGGECSSSACLSSQWTPARTKTSQAASWLGFQDQLSLRFSNWGKKRGFCFVCFFKYKMCKAWSWAGFSLPIRAVDAGSAPGWIRKLGRLKVCRDTLESMKPRKKSSLSLRSPYILSQIILCAETDVPKCVKPLHKVSPVFYFLIQTTSKDFLESLSGLVCRNDLLY